jgi:D-serine deaminase-like pyridoxal phosphate-dependent protein
VFNDLNTWASGACSLEDCAASVLVTVVSTARNGQMIVDGGSKTFSSDRLSSGGPGHGRVTEAPEALFHKMNEEHGFVDLTNANRTFAVGDKVSIVPNHICVVVNLHEYVYGVRQGLVEEVWRVDARGKLQ